MTKTAVLDMHFVGGALYVYMDLWNRNLNRYNTAMLTFDTGATVTTLSNEIVLELGYDVEEGRQQSITTASDVVCVREVVIDRIRFGESELEKIKIYAHDFPEESFSLGVVGLNILTKFDIRLVFSEKRIELERIKE